MAKQQPPELNRSCAAVGEHSSGQRSGRLSRSDNVQREANPDARPKRVLALSAAERADLQRLAEHRPTGLARRAGLILARADGYTLSVIGRRFGVHPDTVRRWLSRYHHRGLAGLRHGNLGKSRNLVFDASLRAEIRRRAGVSPVEFGEAFPTWSLLKLRGHLIRHGVVRTISHEALRQILRPGSLSRRYWCERANRDGRA